MKSLSYSLIVGFAVTQWTVPARAQDDTKSNSAAPQKPSRTELREKQADVSLEARDIERILAKIKRASDLSKTRITEAAKTAESASAALERGNSTNAHGDAKQAAEMFREIAKLLEALLEEETPKRLAAARDLAQTLALNERQLADELQGAMMQANPAPSKTPQPGTNNAAGPNSDNPGGTGDGKNGNAQKDQGSQRDRPQNKSDQSKPDSKPAPGAAGDSRVDPKQEPGNNGGPETGSEKAEKPEGGGSDAKTPDDRQSGGTGTATEKKENGQGGGGQSRDRDPKTGMGAGRPEMTEAARREALAARADKLARTGQTLQDILKSISESGEPADKDSIAKVEAILKETQLLKSIEAMQEVAGAIRSGKMASGRSTSLDVADRMEIAAQRLNATYRAIVAPQIEELRKLDSNLEALREQLEELETRGQVAAWERKARELMEQADKLQTSEQAREDFLEQLKGTGDAAFENQKAWTLVNDRFTPPDNLSRLLTKVQENVQAKIQNLVRGDFVSSADENTPPKYQELVEQYYKVLSRERGAQKRPVKMPAGKKAK